MSIKLLPLLLLALVSACADQAGDGQVEKKLLFRPLEGIAVLGAMEGSWFYECDIDSPEGCEIESIHTMCDLEVSETASSIYSRFLESHGLAGQGAAALKIKGNASKIEGEGFGHMDMSTCQIRFEVIQSIELTDHPFSPPPPSHHNNRICPPTSGERNCVQSSSNFAFPSPARLHAT